MIFRKIFPSISIVITILALVFGGYAYIKANQYRQQVLLQALKVMTTVQSAEISDVEKQELMDQIIEVLSVTLYDTEGFILGFSRSRADDTEECPVNQMRICLGAKTAVRKFTKECTKGEISEFCETYQEFENYIDENCLICELE
jgi:hypothetical protein